MYRMLLTPSFKLQPKEIPKNFADVICCGLLGLGSVHPLTQTQGCWRPCHTLFPYQDRDEKRRGERSRSRRRGEERERNRDRQRPRVKADFCFFFLGCLRGTYLSSEEYCGSPAVPPQRSTSEFAFVCSVPCGTSSALKACPCPKGPCLPTEPSLNAQS